MLTCTVDPGVVELVSDGAFAAERPVRVDAVAVITDAGVHRTLVHI